MDIHVYANGICEFAGKKYDCRLGRGGVIAGKDKREGDRQTPAGSYPLRQVFYRADRGEAPQTVLPVRAIQKGDRWCEDPQDPRYNTLIHIDDPSEDSGLWRNRSIFDVIVVVGHNDSPVVKGAGSGIFMHIMNEDKSPSDGCITFTKEDLLAILSAIKKDTRVVIHEESKK